MYSFQRRNDVNILIFQIIVGIVGVDTLSRAKSASDKISIYLSYTSDQSLDGENDTLRRRITSIGYCFVFILNYYFKKLTSLTYSI